MTAQATRLNARRLLVTRSMILAGVGVGSGALAHLLAGGVLPGVSSVVASGMIATLVSFALLRLGRKTGIALSVVSGQWVFHQAVSFSHVTPTVGHDHGQALTVATDSLAMSAPMGVGHFLAAAFTALATVHADAVLRGVRRLHQVLSRWWVLTGERWFVDSLPPAPMPRGIWVAHALQGASMTGGAFGTRAPPAALAHQ